MLSSTEINSSKISAVHNCTIQWRCPHFIRCLYESAFHSFLMRWPTENIPSCTAGWPWFSENWLRDLSLLTASCFWSYNAGQRVTQTIWISEWWKDCCETFLSPPCRSVEFRLAPVIRDRATLIWKPNGLNPRKHCRLRFPSILQAVKNYDEAYRSVRVNTGEENKPQPWRKSNISAYMR